MTLNIEQKIAQLTKNEYQSLKQVKDSLYQLNDLFRNTINDRNRKDNRGIFAVAYLATTENIIDKITYKQGATSKIFTDPNWVEEYLITFANLYRTALYASTQNLDMPKSWRFAFDKASHDKGIISLQHLMLGINAHVVHDLPVTLYQVGVGNTTEQREKRLQDHTTINQTVKETVNPIQDAITRYHRSQGFSLLEKVLGPFDEWITQRFFVDQRKRAWHNALYLTRLANSQPFEDKLTYWATRTTERINNFDDMKRQIDSVGLEFANALVIWGRLPLPKITGFEDNTFKEFEVPLDKSELALLKEELEQSEEQFQDWTEII